MKSYFYVKNKQVLIPKTFVRYLIISTRKLHSTSRSSKILLNTCMKFNYYFKFQTLFPSSIFVAIKIFESYQK